jgi:MerR family mercuric resistance operon transcriptional regulator
MPSLTIGKLGEQAGVGVETIRYYQRRGLLAVPDRPDSDGLGGGVRRYGHEDVKRLRFIRSAQAAGFTLEEIGTLLACDPIGDRPSIRALAERRIAAIDRQIETLTAARKSLDRLARQCGSGSEGPCPIVEAFGV